METNIVVETAKDEPGSYYWSFTVGGEVYADGVEGSQADATRKARMVRSEWEDRVR